MPIRVRSLDHVTIVSSDLARTQAFYVDLLGMTSVPRPNFSFPGLWFAAGRTYIHVNLVGEEAGPAGQPFATGSILSRGHHLAFEVDDAQAVVEPLRQAGITLVSGPQRRPDGATQVFLHDPDGYLIELFSQPTTTS